MTSRLQRTLAAAIAGLGLGCSLTFPCETDAQCTRNSTPGVCQASGYCSFPDQQCESDQRYGELAPRGLAGTCVPVAGTESGSGSGTTGSGTTAAPMSSGGTTVTPPSTGSPGTTVTLDGTSTASDGSTTQGEGSSSTGRPPVCCHGDCPDACAGACNPVQFAGPAMDSEAVDVVVVDQWVVWSTGIGSTLRITSIEPGLDGLLAAVPDNVFVSQLAADDTHVYFVDFMGPTVRRASVPDGTVELVTQVTEGQANFGDLVVDQTHVYFAMLGSGGVWRAAKDLSDVDAAEPFADDLLPFDIALDATHAYWIDLDTDQIHRLALARAGNNGAIESILDSFVLRALVVDQTHVFVGNGSDIVRLDKDGTNPLTLANGAGLVWDMAFDEIHVYWTTDGGNTVERVRKDGTGTSEVLAVSSSPQGLSLDCATLYWTEAGTATVQAMDK
ncbi:MAG: hypothetical protein K0V04_29930 [Deltaproteobacteria bacterium]|nr:hypothetical protein [Deltaproteobacteria bacterium]